MRQYKKNSLSLTGAVSLGTGVMIGAGIFALLGQVAELSGQWFPIAFLVGAIISGFSAYSYIKMSNAYPSAGGIANYLKKIYGKSALTASGALLMAFSMVINESLVARTFGSYTLQLFDVGDDSIWVPILGVLLLVVAFLINISGNNIIGKSSLVMAILKIGGISIFAIGGLWAAGFSFGEVIPSSDLTEYPVTSYLGALALSILAYKGFTTITNSGGEIVNPNKNVGRAIIIFTGNLHLNIPVGSVCSIIQSFHRRNYKSQRLFIGRGVKTGLWQIWSLVYGRHRYCGHNFWGRGKCFCGVQNDGHAYRYGAYSP
nr:APC family permease [Maribacter sp. Hel_I_7]